MTNYNQYEDEQLLALLKEKSPVRDRAFNALYYRYADRLNSYCLFKSNNALDAEEIFQDTWLRFFNAVQTNNKVILLPAYLYKIARNLCIDRFRVQKNSKLQRYEDFDFEQIADSLNLQGSYEKEELLSLISLAVNTLSDIYKETFILLWFAGLNYSEIADIVGETVECVRMRSYRGMDEVIKTLKPLILEISK